MGASGFDGQSLASFTAGEAPAPPPRTGGRSPRKVDAEAFLALEEEYRRVKQRELAREDKLRQLTAQLARTEEAAKRILVRSDASARGGTAQRLLDAERELARAKAEGAELQSEVERLKKAAADHKQAAGNAKRRLEAALADQRRLAQQVGKLQSACSLGRTQHAAGAGGGGSVGCSKASGDGASLSPEAARRFAAQQEELARAREELARAREEMAALREAEQAAEQQTQQRFRNLVGGLESEILALGRKLQAYEQQLTALGVPLPGPYGAGGAGEHPLLAAVGAGGSLPQAALWVLEEWQHDGCLYLKDPLTNGVYSHAQPQPQQQAGPGAVLHAGSWPQPVGLFCAGTLLATPPRQALKLFLSLAEGLSGHAQRAQALWEPLMQAAGSLEAAVAMLEHAVGHSVAHSDAAALLACVGTDTAAVLQPPAFASSLQEICGLAGAVAAGNCRQLRAVQQKVRLALEERAEDAMRLLAGRAAGAVQYYHLVEWLRMVVPRLSSEELQATVLWLRTWDLHAAGSLQPCDVLRAFHFGALWRIRPAAAAGTTAVRESVRAAQELGRQLGAGREAACLEAALQEREQQLAQRSTEVKALQAKLQEREAALQQAERALAGLQLAQQQEEQRQPQRRASEGEAAGEGVELGRLRLEYLQAKASLESTTACNTRLIKELEEAKLQLAALRHTQAPHLQLHKSPGKENGPTCSPGAAVLAGTPDPAAFPAGLRATAAAAAAAGPLQLQQQLTEARHVAAQLQIELDAAQAKLVIYRAHPMQRQGPQRGLPAGAPTAGAAHSPNHTECRAERLGSKRAVGAPDVRRGWQGEEAPAASSPGRQQVLLPEPAELRGLAVEESIVELHVHAASLEPHAVGPHSMTFLSLDFYEFETQLTPVLEGIAPKYNTTAQFVVTMNEHLLEHLREATLRVELHACATAPAGGVEYSTVARGSIPLVGLLEEAPGAKTGHQQCMLVDDQGRRCGSVQYTLCALRPIRAPARAPAGLFNDSQAGSRPSPAKFQPQLRESNSPAVAAAEGVWKQQQAAGGGAQGAPCALGMPGGPAASGGGYQETTYVRYTRVDSPPPGSLAAGRWGGAHATCCFPAAVPPGDAVPGGQRGLEQQPQPPPPQQLLKSVAAAAVAAGEAGSPAAPGGCRRLHISGLACQGLRVADAASAQPYISLFYCSGQGNSRGLDPMCCSGGRSGSGGGSRGARRLSRQGWLYETRPASGASPQFGDAVIPLQVPQAGETALEVVVFDAAAGADCSAGAGMVGAARVALPPPGERSAGGARVVGSFLLVHPATGRHAGVVEMGLAWE